MQKTNATDSRQVSLPAKYTNIRDVTAEQESQGTAYIARTRDPNNQRSNSGKKSSKYLKDASLLAKTERRKLEGKNIFKKNSPK